MADTFQFEIVTPDRQVVKDVAEEMEIPGRDGYLGILPGHAPLITELGVGEITYRNASVTHRFAVAWASPKSFPTKSPSSPKPPSAPPKSTLPAPKRPKRRPSRSSKRLTRIPTIRARSTRWPAQKTESPSPPSPNKMRVPFLPARNRPVASK